MYPAEFELPVHSLIHDVGNRGYRLELASRSTLLTESHIETIRGLVAGELSFPARFPHPGRTILCCPRANSGWAVRGLKFKGPRGLYLNGRQWHTSPPQPLTPFEQSTLHWTLDPAIRFKWTRGQARTQFCASLVGSKNECKAQNLAAKHGVGFRPLAAGRLTDTEGGVVKDKFGTELGVAVIEFDPDFLRLSDVIGLIALQMGETETYIHRPVIGPLSGREVTQEECIRYTISAFERVGALRRTFHSTLGLCRHAGHPGNFLFNPRTDQLFVTDLDSCVPIESLLPEARGPQILRDLTSDLFRCVQNLLYRFFTDEFIVGMSQGKYDPFTGYLRNYFGQQVDDSTIRNTGVSLLIGTLSFLDEYGDALRGVYPDISGPVTRAILNGTPMPGSPGWSSWYFNLIPLYMVFIEHLYLLLRQTELLNGEACLPTVSVGELRNGVAQGLAEFILEILKEDAQLRARQGAGAVT